VLAKIRSHRRIAIISVAAFITAAGVLSCGVDSADADSADADAAKKPGTHTVVIEGLRFDPETLDVKAADTIVWVNKDPFPHTATSTAGGFDSHEIAAGKSWKFTPKETGVFAYVCALHPTMKATIRVSVGGS
jgi:plastocyanin